MILKQVLSVEQEMPFPVAKVPDAGPQRTVALLLGIVTVLVLSGFLLGKIRYWHESGKRSTPSVPIQAVVPVLEQDRLASASSTVALPTSHVVQEGENLWSIAEYYYTSGNNSIDIMEANKLYSPDQIAVGQTLLIPKVPIRPTNP